MLYSDYTLRMEEKTMEPRMLKDLLAGLTYTVAENCSITEEALAEMEIPAVICDDRKLQEGCLFICCRYTNFNGPASLPAQQ